MDATEEKRCWTVQEVSEIIGLTPKTLYKAMELGILTYGRSTPASRSTRIMTLSDLEGWLGETRAREIFAPHLVNRTRG